MDHARFLEFFRQVKSFLPSQRVIDEPTLRLAYGTDASFYRLVPRLVLRVENEAEMVQVCQLAQGLLVPITFRAAGTSLSGQAVTDSVLVALGSSWRRAQVLEDGGKIRLQPGLTGGRANQILAPYKRKIGPDPASINSAFIGGIAANNASGMCCGTAQNSYQTLESLRVILADGTLLDTGDQISRDSFRQSHAAMLSKLSYLAERVKQDQELAQRIKKKFSIKNTTGYSLNALVDFSDPFQILQHLLIGSEGTLGFMSSVTYQTLPEADFKASALMLFDSMESACQAVIALKKTPVAAVELIDRAGLTTIESKPGLGELVQGLPPEAAALLVEVRCQEQESLWQKIDQCKQAIAKIATLKPIAFTDKPAEYGLLWDIRKGLFPAVGAMRATGTTVIIEDVAFPIQSLAKATLDLQALFKKHHYHEAIIFGHALEGNLHFVFTQDFSTQAEVDRYEHFMEEVCNLVVDKYDGSLKAEHGTGRNMAPFVEKEWGPKAYQLMKEIKEIFDPKGVLNPGVILNDDPKTHVKNLKPLPAAHSLVDKCIECGFCEVQCPSKDFTFTPRQRIVIWRELSRLSQAGNQPKTWERTKKIFDYYGEQSCATDGLCATACPVGINTGNLIKEIRHQETSPQKIQASLALARNYGLSSKGAGWGLGLGSLAQKLVGAGNLAKASLWARKATGGRFPLVPASLPGQVRFSPFDLSQGSRQKVVYFPACIARMMGPSAQASDARNLPEAMLELLAKARLDVVFPTGLAELCCGKSFDSKGLFEAAKFKSDQLNQALLEASQGGELPILCDTSPCLAYMKETLDPRLKLYEPLEFTKCFLLDRLHLTQQDKKVAIHATCSTKKMGLEGLLRELAGLCAKEVIEPQGITCCGFAGDKGFFLPELNASALAPLQGQLPPDCQEGYSTSNTCEIGLSTHGQIPYRSIIYLVSAAAEPKKDL